MTLDGDLEVGVLAQVLHAMHDLAREALLQQLRRQFGRDDGDGAVLLGRREALLLAPVHQQLVRRERLAGDLHRQARRG